MIRKPALIVAFVALVAPGCAGQQTAPPTPLQQGYYNVEQLLELMDRDKDGTVSRAEFMKFMGEEFDQLDVNKDGKLDVNELTALRLGPRPSGGTGK